MNLSKAQYIILVVIMALYYNNTTLAQGLHFSQYYNAPMLLNPANTALMSSSDYRLGVNYRDQWSSIPVPFRTVSAFADFQAFRNQNLTNWMGFGLAMFSDKAGDGQLAMGRYEGFLAYHIQTGNFSMISVGFSGAYVQRSVDFNKLSFDRQWDGFKFDQGISSQENKNLEKTAFADISAGVNYAYYPNENTYIKLGVGVAHVNMPKETFLGSENKIGMRPTASLDALFITGYSFTVNPSVYYTRQGNSQELVGGVQAVAFLSEDNLGNPTNIIFGGYYRLKEAVIPMVGFEWAGVRFTTSYDFTLSRMTSATKLKGALEFALIYQGRYTSMRDKMN
jgi:type IX secretion system PorP/SprF family membrane protein